VYKKCPIGITHLPICQYKANFPYRCTIHSYVLHIVFLSYFSICIGECKSLSCISSRYSFAPGIFEFCLPTMTIHGLLIGSSSTVKDKTRLMWTRQELYAQRNTEAITALSILDTSQISILFNPRTSQILLLLRFFTNIIKYYNYGRYTAFIQKRVTWTCWFCFR